jgi:DNA-binding IclR family transcriptional regulator
VCAPILADDGTLVAAIGISALARRLDRAELDRHAAVVRRAARDATARLA